MRTLSPALITSLSANIFPNKLAPNLPNKQQETQPFVFYFLFNCLSKVFYQKVRIFKRLNYFHTIYMPQILRSLLWIPGSLADSVGVKPNSIRMLSANGVSTFFINCNPTLIQETYQESTGLYFFRIIEFFITLLEQMDCLQKQILIY